ncbi:MAG TPA: flagellar protein FlgN [Desulfatiglandales bacterium]|nr:flagellar protein FlgN [Desulfatiglandales bacterium]
MNENAVHLLEDLFQRKIILYDDLLRCLEKERESLVTINMDALWAISKEKEELCSKIESIRQEIVSVVDIDGQDSSLPLNRILGLVPEEKAGSFQGFFLTLVKLKNEIELSRKANMVFIKDSLRFLDEMISIITGGNKSKMVYDERSHLSKSGINCFLSREV